MRTSIVVTIASLFLIGSYSLPQPENLEASKTIEDREPKVGPGGPLPSHSGSAEWWTYHQQDGDGGSPASNATKVKEREAYRERPSETPSGLPESFHHGLDNSGSGTNDTKIKERQEGPPAGHDFAPPDGITWMEYMKHKKQKGGSASQDASVPVSTGTSNAGDTGTLSTGNSTKVSLMHFRD